MTAAAGKASRTFADHATRETVLHIDPATAAVLVVDMLNDFVDPAGKMPLADGASVIAPIRGLVDGMRSLGASIVWICDRHQPDDREFAKRDPHCLDGTWGAQVIPQLSPQPGDREVAKRRYSAFFGTDLDLLLRELGIRTVVAAGVVTNICVRSTVHDAFFRGYQVVVPEDCVKATSAREQRSTLFDIDTHFGTVSTSAACLAAAGGDTNAPTADRRQAPARGGAL
jgi:ureidoacrylate peracid hydrolase